MMRDVYRSAVQAIEPSLETAATRASLERLDVHISGHAAIATFVDIVLPQ